MRRAQQGIALIGILALLTMGAAWWLVSALATPASRVASDREHNAKVLAQAKAALIGTVGLMAGDVTLPENNPGRLPCPEPANAANNHGGVTFTDGDDGVAAPNCLLPAVGRLPWRTLGIDKLVDAAGEPLWYVVSPAWALSNATLPPLQTTINSNGPAGQLTLDLAGDLVALIVAPGRPLNIQAGGGCVARNQQRVRVPNNPWDVRDFLDCTNSDGDAVFASGGPAGSFNDQVVAVTRDELLPVIESAIANRFVKQFGPSMRYCGGLWPPCAGGGAAVYLPFAAPFGDPAAANFQGGNGTMQGLLPLSFSGTGPCLANTPMAPFCAPPPACNPALDNRCAPALVTYRDTAVIARTGGGSTLSSYSCSVAGTPSTLSCTIYTQHSIFTALADRWMSFTLDLTSNNIGLALRQVNDGVQMSGVDAAAVRAPYGYTVDSAAMNADASARVRVSSRLPGGGTGLPVADLLCGLAGLLGIVFDCVQHTITLPFLWVDQPMLYANNATMQWFYRNNWHQLSYYAVSAGNAPSGPGNCAGATCLSVNGPTLTNTQRALLVTTGRAVGGQARPGAGPTQLAQWLEGGNADGNTVFAARDPVLQMNRAFNDHVIAIDSN